jgi:3D (Asp-Asp-Asp) domain-containing protein
VTRLAALSGVLVLLAVSAATASGPGSLQAQSHRLGSRTHRAVLDLYVLDTRLGNAQARLRTLQTQAAQLRAEQQLIAQNIAATTGTLAVSRQQLGANLRTLYKQGDTDPLAVMLGSQSLSDALTQIDDLNRVARESEQVVAVTSAAQVRLGRLRATLAQRRAQVDADLAAAEATTRELAAARSDKLSYITWLRSEQQLKQTQIAALAARAQHAEVKSQQIQAAATPPAPVPATTDPAATTTTTPAAAPRPSERTLTVSSTGYSLPGHTSTGIPVGWGVVAVDPSVIPLGTRLTIPGYGDGVAADTGSAVRGADIDLWFPTLAQALAWGRRTVTITLH